jgi:hypothetical protein
MILITMGISGSSMYGNNSQVHTSAYEGQTPYGRVTENSNNNNDNNTEKKQGFFANLFGSSSPSNQTGGKKKKRSKKATKSRLNKSNIKSK